MRREREPWWQEGKNLQKFWLDTITNFRKERASQFERLDRLMLRDAPFLRAVIHANRGDPSVLIDLLRSDLPITADDREVLADYLEGKFKPPPQLGRMRGKARDAARIAAGFFEEWKAHNARLCINDYRHRSKMKDEVVRFVVEDYLPELGADWYATRNNLQRPKARQL